MNVHCIKALRALPCAFLAVGLALAGGCEKTTAHLVDGQAAAPDAGATSAAMESYADESSGWQSEPDEADTNHEWDPAWNGGVEEPDQADAGPPVTRNPGDFPTFTAALSIGNQTGGKRVVRVRYLKPGVSVKCKVIMKAPNLALARALFAPAEAWILPSGRSIALNPPGAPPQGCRAVLIDGSGFAMRLAFWMPDQYLPQSMPSTVNGTPPSRLLAIVAEEGGATLKNHPALFPAPPTFDLVPGPGCEQAEASAGVAWSEPVPTGSQTIIGLAVAPDGCAKMELLGKTGIETWFLCAPPGAMPFAAGDSIAMSPITSGHDLGDVQGVELMAIGKRIRVAIGEETVYFGKGAAAIESAPGCMGLHDACGSLSMPLNVSITPEGGKATIAKPGEGINLGAGRTLWVVRARELPVANSACTALGSGAAGRRVESVYTEVTP